MNPILKYSLAFVLFVFFQLFLLNNLTLWQVATPYVFILFLLMLPLRIPTPIMYLIAFGTGLFIDIFSQTYGLSAFSSLMAVGLRESWIRFITTSSYRSLGDLSLGSQSLAWYAFYLFPLILVYNLAYFFLEAHGFNNLFYTLLKIVSSTIYSFSLCFLLTAIAYRR